MSEKNKTYRLRTKVGVGINAPETDKYLTVNLNDTFDTIEVLSLKIHQENLYRVHSSQYGVIVGRAVANGGFGVPNVKVSVFIPADQDTLSDPIKSYIYSYTSYTGKNTDGVRYNLLPDENADDPCYQAVGTFPNKRLILDDDNYLEIFDKYYKYTTKTNAAGDYMIFGVPVGSQTIHTDMDLSDVGVLSQRPRDFIYKGYNKNQFETPNKFKTSTNLNSLPQIVSQDGAVYVYPFWGDTNENIIGITRYDIDIDYKFEPTCVFMGSMVSDNSSSAISKKCAPSENMGVMDELVTGEGTIEMIRKTATGAVEEFPIQGNQLIDSHGVWCYQIPMNLDYVMTDEYGNLVPSDNPDKGIPTRARVRFRVSMKGRGDDNVNLFRGKVLVPNNPDMVDDTITPDYIFGTLTEESSYRDLLWNNIYTVKSFIPRFQKNSWLRPNASSNTNRRFSGIKQCNYYGSNNPIPYNNIRVRLSFQFRIACLVVKILLVLIGFYNKTISVLSKFLINLGSTDLFPSWLRKLYKKSPPTWKPLVALEKAGKSLSCLYVDGNLCSQLEGEWYFAPGCSTDTSTNGKAVWLNMFSKIEGKKGGEVSYGGETKSVGDGTDDIFSNDKVNARTRVSQTSEDITYEYAIANGIDYFKQCVEISLAEEYKVIQFDFYNDWINGLLYIPKWERHIRRKRRFFLFGPKETKIRACTDTYRAKRINLTDQCSLSVNLSNNASVSNVGCGKKYRCHEEDGRNQVNIMQQGGIVHEELTRSKLYAYYFKPSEVVNKKKVNLFATDIVLLGSMNPYNISETPMFVDALEGTTYQLPSPLVFTDSEEEGTTFKIKGGDNNLIQPSGYKGVYVKGNNGITPNQSASFTEAAGIDWSLSGPGQGDKNIGANYTPGGHFIGISCMNAETTTKTCVNVKRICEAGVSPSSSYEVQYLKDGDTYAAEVVANGLIAKDEISESDFRKVFATLNHKKLISEVGADNVSKYCFFALYPENFGGEMANYVKSNYNVSLYKNGVIEDEGKDISGYVNDDIDTGYTTNIVRRSLEEKDDDYLRFRYGLDALTQSELIKKFLLSPGRGYAMPVYENSFYFYFGLHNGYTAIDLLKDNFFAECEKPEKTESLKVSLFNADEADLFTAPQEVGVFSNGIAVTSGETADSFPYFSINSEIYPLTLTYRGMQATVTTQSEDDDGEANGTTTLSYWNTGFQNDKNEIPIGTHTYTITDGDGRTVVKTLNVKRAGYEICPTIEPVDFSTADWIEQKNNVSYILNGSNPGRVDIGGYFKVDCKSYFYKYDYRGSTHTVSLVDADIFLINKKRVIHKAYTSQQKYILNQFKELFSEDDGYEYVSGLTAGNGIIPVDEVGRYDIYIIVKANDSSSLHPVLSQPILVMANAFIGEPDSYDLTIFRREVSSPEDAINSYRLSFVEAYSCNWIEQFTSRTSRIFTEDQKWYIKKDALICVDKEEEKNRVLKVTAFYGETLPVPTVHISQNTGNTGTEKTSFTKNEALSHYQYISLMANGEVKLPNKTYCNSKLLPFYCREKIFEPSQCVFWEGYPHTGSTALRYTQKRTVYKDNPDYGSFRGIILNGISYNGALSSIVLNESISFPSTGLTVSGDDMSGRSVIKTYCETGETYAGLESVSIQIEEGHPEVYDAEYEPLTVSASTETVGTEDEWDAYIFLFFKDKDGSGDDVKADLKLCVDNIYPLTNPSYRIYSNTDSGGKYKSTKISMYMRNADSPSSAIGSACTLGIGVCYLKGMDWSDGYGFVRSLTDTGLTTTDILGETMVGEDVSDFTIISRNLIRDNISFSFGGTHILSAFNSFLSTGNYFNQGSNRLPFFINLPDRKKVQYLSIALPIGDKNAADHICENVTSCVVHFSDGGTIGHDSTTGYGGYGNRKWYIDLAAYFSPVQNRRKREVSKTYFHTAEFNTSFEEEGSYENYKSPNISGYTRSTTGEETECTINQFFEFCLKLPNSTNGKRSGIMGDNFYVEIETQNNGDNNASENSTCGFRIKEYYDIVVWKD